MQDQERLRDQPLIATISIMRPENRRAPVGSRQHGFTLLELMVVVALTGILLGLGIPSFQTIITNNRIAANSNEFVTALNFARSEAVKRGAPVSVCKSPDGTRCATSGGWEQGWVSFVGDEIPPPNQDIPSAAILRIFDALSGDDTLDSDADALTYTALGALNGDDIEFEFGLCRKGFNQGKNVVAINAVGRASVRRESCD